MIRAITIASVLLFSTTAYACADLEANILHDDEGDVLELYEVCAEVEMTRRYFGIFHPKDAPTNDTHRCKLLGLERLDRTYFILHTYCEYRQGNKNSDLAIQLIGDDVVLTNVENY